MKQKGLVIALVILTVISIGGVAFAVKSITSEPEVTQTSQAQLVVNENSYDWGQIGINDGNVTHQFTLTNQGTEPLQVYNVKTSCSCTNAQLKDADGMSPLFGMHSNSNYVLDIAPGKSAQLEVIYDPDFHGPGGVGSVTRQVTFQTNDPRYPEMTFVVRAEVSN